MTIGFVQYARMVTAAVIVAAAMTSKPAALRAQTHEVDVDVIPVTGSLTYAWQHAAGRYWGVLAGIGWDEFGITVKPDQDDPGFHELEQILFIGGMHRWRTARLDIDVGVRLGLGDVRTTGDLPSPYYAVYGSALWGGRRVRIGPRLFVARVHDTGNADTSLHLDVVTARIILGRIR